MAAPTYTQPPVTENVNISNGIPPPKFDLPFPDSPENITANVLKLNEGTPDPRTLFVFTKLIEHLHGFIKETKVTTEEWMSAIQFLTRVGQKSTPLRQEFILLSDILGVSALVDCVNNPGTPGITESSVLGPFHTDDAPHLEHGDSIASEGKGEYLYVEGTVRDIDGKPIEGAVIDTWQADEDGLYDTQYVNRDAPDLRGRLTTDKNGHYEYRAVVPDAYPIPGDGPVGELLISLGRHNMRPAHIHFVVEASGYRTLTTAIYPEGNPYIKSDCVFGVKESLVVKMSEVHDEGETRRRGFPSGNKFKQVKFDVVMERNQ
ncbi:hypothetical protein ONZ45_g9965 [Pleurotus djamor]|nr:hypothetical protein ONZ45_g9965 [Pleurotus djamor]